MNPDELAAFGVDEACVKMIQDWIMERIAFVLGADGRGGSGTFVRLKDGTRGVVTARHVVVSCILTGELTVMRFAGGRSIEPKSIRIDNHRDVAFLELDVGKLPGAEVLEDEWLPGDAAVDVGMPAIVSGAVGEWKEPDLERRVIPLTTVLHYWTAVTENEGLSGCIVCDVDERQRELPESFGGMSGGPMVSLDQRLMGVNTAERRRLDGADVGEFFVTRLSSVAMFKPSARAMITGGVVRQVAMVGFTAQEIDEPHRVAPVAVRAEFYSSVADPTVRIGRIIAMVIGAPKGAERYIINTESQFEWSGDDTEASRIAALDQEIDFFLEDTDFRRVRPPSIG